MFKIITMCDSNYFDCGKLFLQTRNIIKDHDIILYGPDLTEKQQNILTKNNIFYKKVDNHIWNTQMQFMKFDNILKELKNDKEKKYKGFFLIDWDVFFINDWSKLYDYDFDLCITVRPVEIKKRILRAYGCGGGFFFKHSGKKLFEYARKVILNGGDIGVPEYDRIWKTLENGRSKNKTHYRTTLRWWVDQVFISCIVLRYLEEKQYKEKFGMNPIFTKFNGFKIAFVSERNYNAIKSDAIIKKEKNIFVRHLQYHGRSQIVGQERAKIKEKLDG